MFLMNSILALEIKLGFVSMKQLSGIDLEGVLYVGFMTA
jgi:hypothetical protein